MIVEPHHLAHSGRELDAGVQGRTHTEDGNMFLEVPTRQKLDPMPMPMIPVGRG